ncbi:MAG: lipoprotein-releasing ABC transporter permease subunit [Pseudomonadota bacterium]
MTAGAQAEPGRTPSAEAPRGAGAFSGFEFMLAWRYLRSRRRHGGVTLISAISFFAIMLAVAALIVVMSVMNGFRHELLTRLLGVQAHVYVFTEQLTAEETARLSERIRGVDGVRQASPIIQGQGLVSAISGAAFAGVVGVNPQDLAQFDLVTGEGEAGPAGGGLVQGSIEGFGEGRNGGDIVLMGSGMASQLGVGAGDEVTLLSPGGASTAFGQLPRRKVYRVGAVVSVGVQQVDEILLFMPFEQAALFFNKPPDGDYIDVRVEDPSAPDPVAAAIREFAPPGSIIFDWRRQNQSFWTALQVERTAMRLILSIIIAIATLNIISGLVMLVKNKSRDIAILRTMGASRGAVMRVFLIAGTMIGVLGAAAGILVGLIVVANIGPIQDFIALVTGVNVFDPEVYYLYRLPARIDWGELVYVTVFAFAMSLLATLPPSWRASRLDPVEALRYE